MVRLLAEPANIRTRQCAARAVWQIALSVTVMVGEGGTAAIRCAPALKQFAVDVDHLLRTRGFMKAVYVLRAKKQFSGGAILFPRGQRDVRRVGFGIAGAGTTVRVILPNQLGIALPRFDIRQLVMAVATPTGSLKDGDPAFRTDARPGEDEYFLKSRAERGNPIHS